MFRFAAAAFLASLLAGTAMAQTVSGTTNAIGKTVSGAATSVSNTAKSATASVKAMATGEYPDEASAKAHCPTDTVVWANLTSKAYHMAGAKSYGKTKKGAYMCQKDAISSGFHAPKAKHASAKPATAAKTN